MDQYREKGQQLSVDFTFLVNSPGVFLRPPRSHPWFEQKNIALDAFACGQR